MVKAQIQLKTVFMVVFIVVNGTEFVGKGNSMKKSRIHIHSSIFAVTCYHEAVSFPIFFHKKLNVCVGYSITTGWNLKDYKFSVNKSLVYICAKIKPVIIEVHTFPYTGQELPEKMLKINTFTRLL